MAGRSISPHGCHPETSTFIQELTGGNYNQFRSKTRVRLAELGTLSVSGTYVHNERRGDVRNLGAGTTWTLPRQPAERSAPERPRNGLAIKTAIVLPLPPDCSRRPESRSYNRFDYTKNDYTDNAQGVALIGGGPAGGLAQAAYLAQDPALRTPLTTQASGRRQ